VNLALESERHASRRAQVLEALGKDAALIVTAAPELRAGLDGELRYAVDANVYWLTGYTEPEVVIVLCPSSTPGPFTLFVRPRDPDRELWTGRRGGVEAAREEFGADTAWPIAELEQRLPSLIGHVSTLFARLEYGRPEVDALIMRMLAHARRTRPRTGKGPHTLVDPAVLLDELRLIKDDSEIARLREAAHISAEAFREIGRHILPAAGEWQIEALLDAGFRSRGASGPAFPTIVATGANATILHYVENAREMQEGELVLIDAGARRAMYCADISRTFPVSGRFTAEQRSLYELVHAAHDAAIAATRPGNTIDDVLNAALHHLLDGLIAFGFLAGSRAELLKEEAQYRRFLPHRAAHWLGLDVHDVGDYTVNGAPRRLEAGMVLTIEPGLYIGTDETAVPLALRGTGIRIEDDVLVTKDGCEVLTSEMPVDPDDLVALMD
jgi:Xaa-Pro aminopeptidase